MFFEGIKNFLFFLYENWTMILVLAGCGIGVGIQVVKYLSTSKDAKITQAKRVIETIMLKLVTEAEEAYLDLKKSGAIKRSVVIAEIYEQFPILNKVIDQNALILWLDKQINIALETLRKTLEENAEETVNAER